MKVITTMDQTLLNPSFKKEFVTIRVNAFNEAAAKEFANQLGDAHSTGQTFIPIFIDSYGGAVDSLLAMISEIEHSRLPIATVVQGKSMSCGSILMSCGTKGMRYIDQHARVMIHEVSQTSWGKLSEIESDLQEVKRLNEQIFRILEKNTSKFKGWFEKEMAKRKNLDWFLTAQEAKKMGLVDHIGVPYVTRDVTVTYELKN